MYPILMKLKNIQETSSSSLQESTPRALRRFGTFFDPFNSTQRM